MDEKKYNLSVGASRMSIDWQPVAMTWTELQLRLSRPQRTTETSEAYFKLSKAEQGKLKDVGGFVGGTLNGPHRKAQNVTGRDLITLDLDNIPANETSSVVSQVKSLGVDYIIYSTRSHLPTRPRLRIVLPLSRTVTADEYEPIARKVASWVGMAFCDPTTFEASRLMYWPSCSSDSEYVYLASNGSPEVDADNILAQYEDWRDVSRWPVVPGEGEKTKTLLAKQEDPTKKQGLVGAFCRQYSIYRAIEELIPNAYTPTDNDERWTFAGGSTVGGAVIYDNGLFLYSHHATDPCSGKLVNAFDLVRLHLFGDMDKDVSPKTNVSKYPSYVAMQEKVATLPDVMGEINRERVERAKASDLFNNLDAQAEAAPTEESSDWLSKLATNSKAQVISSRNNVFIILSCSPDFKGKIVTDEFSERLTVRGALPWNDSKKAREWTDADDAGLCWYMETYYNITGTEKIMQAFAMIAASNRYNPVREYLDGLTWDGVKRLDRLFVDYLGAEDTPYNRAVARKSMVAGVKRIYSPGCKYDQMPVLIGPQGIGKSTLLAKLGKRWYSDSIQTFEGKEASEQLQGVWIIEVGEMAGYNKSDTNSVKLFLSKTDDIYRRAYGRRTENHPRRCVFFGTSNFGDFLKDPTGNRRFWPVDVGRISASKSVIKDLEGEVDQLWAEAKNYYVLGEPIIMEDRKLADEALAAQTEHREANPREGLIIDYLERDFPQDYDSWDLEKRRTFLAGGMACEGELVKKQKVCALELWCEVFRGNPRDMRQSDTREINQILAHIPGWEKNRTSKRYGYCGTQRGFNRIK